MSNLERKIVPLFDVPYKECGRDENGCDCWGLVLLFYETVFNRTLPTYEDVVLRVGHGTKAREDAFKKVAIISKDDLFEEVTDPEFGDIVLLYSKGRPLHAGVAIGDNRILHTGRATGVVVENYLEDKWKSRLKGFYRPKVV